MDIATRKIDVAFISSFYPRIDRLATTSTGMVFLMRKSGAVRSVTVFSPKRTFPPEDFDQNVKTIPIWEYDDPLSLIKMLMYLLRRRKKFDLFFFNLILTSFGKGKISNACGLLIPVVLRLFGTKSIVVYMHNFVETQDLGKLGYSGRFFSKVSAKLIEVALVKSVKVIVPLPSQRTTVNRLLGGNVTQGIIAGVEGLWSYCLHLNFRNYSVLSKPCNIRILLFGSWGPQKDIIGILRALRAIDPDFRSYQIRIAGSVNSNFPEYEQMLKNEMRNLDPGVFKFSLNPEDWEIPEIFIDSDILILPYKAAGGYSAVMNISKLYSLKIISYDVSELREFSELINLDVEFIREGNIRDLQRAINSFVWKPEFSEKHIDLIETGMDTIENLLK